MLIRERDVCLAWALDKREVTRIYFYGSRVWGNPRPDSDLDVLVVAHPGAMIGSAEEWTAELTSLLKMTVHLNDHFTADSSLMDRVKASGLLAFSRHNSDLDFEFEDVLKDFDPDTD